MIGRVDIAGKQTEYTEIYALANYRISALLPNWLGIEVRSVGC
jgi:hypothetical protein